MLGVDQESSLDATEAIAMEKYLANIEIANACRELYTTRVKSMEITKEKLCLTQNNIPEKSKVTNERKMTSIDTKMETLRTEMVSTSVLNTKFIYMCLK